MFIYNKTVDARSIDQCARFNPIVKKKFFIPIFV